MSIFPKSYFSQFDSQYDSQFDFQFPDSHESFVEEAELDKKNLTPFESQSNSQFDSQIEFPIPNSNGSLVEQTLFDEKNPNYSDWVESNLGSRIPNYSADELDEKNPALHSSKSASCRPKLSLKRKRMLRFREQQLKIGPRLHVDAKGVEYVTDTYVSSEEEEEQDSMISASQPQPSMPVIVTDYVNGHLVDLSEVNPLARPIVLWYLQNLPGPPAPSFVKAFAKVYPNEI